jgi:hypothetical protein
MEFEWVTKNAKSCERLSDGSASDSHGRRLKAGCSQEWLPHSAAEPQTVVAILQGRGGRVQGRQAD